MKLNIKNCPCFSNSFETMKNQLKNKQIPKSLDEVYKPIKRKASHKRRINEDSDSDNDNDNYNVYYDYNYDEHKYDTDDSSVQRKRKHKKTDDTKSNNEKVNSNTINCPICYEDVKIPYVTNCNHNFCYSCVDKLISRSTNNEWACPICRKICKK